MAKKAIKQEFEKGFNRSSKIMEYKLGINEARLLNTLIYKYNYWKEWEELNEIDLGLSFYITIPNLQVETNLGHGVIKRTLKKLKESGLVKIYRKGNPAKNHYILNREAIENFDAKYLEEYQTWCEKIYQSASEDRARFDEVFKKNSSPALMESQIGQNDLTSEVKMTQLVGSKCTVTNNKNTNNKKLKTITNRTSAEELHDKYLDELIKELDFLIDPYSEYDESNSRFFDLMKKMVPRFEKFSISHRDSIMIDRMGEYSLNSNEIAFKILSNVSDIIDGNKEVRFGNLFVGLEEMNENKELSCLAYGT